MNDTNGAQTISDSATAVSQISQSVNEPPTPSTKELDDLGRIIRSFFDDLSALRSTSEAVMFFLAVAQRQTATRFKSYRDTHAKNIRQDADGSESAEFDLAYLREAQGRLRDIARYNHAARITPDTFLITLVSQFDAYLGKLLKAIYRKKGELIKSSQKSFTYAELINFGSIEDATEYLIDKEIEDVLRQSHTKQFELISEICAIELRKNLPIWPKFIEVTERRNLLAHAGGVVSRQYIAVCTQAGLAPQDIAEVGQRLVIGKEYFDAAIDAVLEIGLKLGQVLWRKQFPSEKEQADRNLNSISYECIQDERYSNATMLLDFAFDVIEKFKFSNDQWRLYLLLNRANAYALLGDQAKADTILSSQDWSTLDIVYRIASASVEGKFDECAKLMKEIGAKGKVSEFEFRDWPIFKRFRDTELFQTTFNDIFGRPFTVQTTAAADAPKMEPYSNDPKDEERITQVIESLGKEESDSLSKGDSQNS